MVAYRVNWCPLLSLAITMFLILRTTILTTVLLLVVASLFAKNPQDRTGDRKTATLTSKEAEPAHIDAAVDDLQGVVVLCATEPDSTEFKKQWRDYVRRHKISKTELGFLIFRVINDAEAYRGNLRLNRSEAPNASRDRREKIYRSMHDTAMAVIRKMG